MSKGPLEHEQGGPGHMLVTLSVDSRTISLLQSPPMTDGDNNPQSAGYSKTKCKEMNAVLST